MFDLVRMEDLPMLKKMILLAALALSMASTFSMLSASEQSPTPPCYPCDGGGGN
jgi:hypothetical protein